ncbi:hypothetical protein ACQF36_06620 [Streptomyces sp. Marseille-Q5077]|uniref:hypothetical protein n=1 Tax=Streptomyces sp. Marseille-Q5077 TaxID=3418995 RepID=UPI003CFFDD5B
MNDNATRNIQTPSEHEKEVDGKLTTIAQIMAASFVAVAGVGTAFGLSQESLLNAVNNDSIRYWFVAGLALAAIIAAIFSLFPGRDTLGNKFQGALLVLASIFYVVGLFLTFQGVTNYATSSGKPNLTEIKIEGDQQKTLSFTVHADSVKKKGRINVEVHSFDEKGRRLPEGLSYRALLQPDDMGDAEQKVALPILLPGEATHLTVATWDSKEEPADCLPNSSRVRVGCVTIPLSNS